MEDYSDITIIIPTFNEADNIRELLNILTSLYPKVSIIVSDDGSKDDTQKIVNEHSNKNKKIKLLDRGKNSVHGLTISVLDAGLMVQTKYFVVIDGDLQHPPEKIKEIAEKLSEGASVVVGTREKVLVKWPWHRKLMSLGASSLGKLRLFLGGSPVVKDPVSGFFGAKTGMFKEIVQTCKNRFEPRGYKVLFDYLKLLPKQTSTAEVLYDFGLRARGQSKIRMNHVILYLKSIFK